MITKCLVCGKERQISPSQIKRGRGKYCSKKCEGINLNKKIKSTCLICNKDFLARPTDIKRGFGRYCSHKCSNLSTRLGKNIACLYCGKEFYKMPSRKSVFCSRKCRSDSQIGVSLSPSRIKNMRIGVIKALLDGRGISSPTSIEIKLYDELQDIGVVFYKQILMHKKFLVDAYIPEFDLVIEADGDYWHSLPKIVKKDMSENAYLKKCGHNVLRLKESEINDGSFNKKIEIAIRRET